jgi:hypothetical protein
MIKMNFCSNCGNQLRNEVNFCDKCGFAIASLKAEEKNKFSDSINISDPAVHNYESKTADESNHIVTFVGNNHNYFINKWSKLTPGKVISWNWAAFFFGFAWLAYRKVNIVWGIGIGWFVILAFIEAAFPELRDSNKYYSIVSLLPGIIAGQQGNYWYKLYTEKSIKELSSKYSNNNLNQELSNRGGTSISNAIAFIFVTILVMVVLEIILFGI